MLINRNNLPAFSLIETIITLGICCGILLIGTLQLKKYQERLIFDNTVKEVTTAIDQASRVSTITGEGVVIIFSQSEHYLKLSGRTSNKKLISMKTWKYQDLEIFILINTAIHHLVL